MTPKDLPISGYTILAAYSTNQLLKPLPKTDDSAQEQVSISWDWRWLERRVLEVRLVISVASPGRRSHISSDCIGRFHQVDDTPTVDLDEFVSLQAVAMLLPYARQYLSTLTLNTLAGPYVLPSLNVMELRRDFKIADATGRNQDVSALAPGSKAPSRITRGPARKKR